MTEGLFKRIGLIGSSLARAIRARGLAKTLVCHTPAGGGKETARALGLVDDAVDDAADAAKGADLVVLAAPPGANADIAARIGAHLAPGAIVTDVGSVKMAVVRDVSPHLPTGAHLAPGHPIAGPEHSGPEAGFASLFADRWRILTPPPGTDRGAVARVARYGRPSARPSMKWIPRTMTRCWPSPRTYPT